MVAVDRPNPSNDEASENVKRLQQERSDLLVVNELNKPKKQALVAKTRFKANSIRIAFFVLGAICGFGLLSILTGFGGLILGNLVAGYLVKPSDEEKDFLRRELRIDEINRILARIQ